MSGVNVLPQLLRSACRGEFSAPLLLFVMANSFRPAEPGSFNVASFLAPLLDDLAQLAVGVHAVDMSNPASPEYFVLRAFMILLIGDQPAMNKLTGLRGHGARFGCRMCLFEGVKVPGAGLGFFYPHINRGELEVFCWEHMVERRGLAEIFTELCNGEPASQFKRILDDNGITVPPKMSLPIKKPFALAVPGGGLHLPRSIPYGPMHVFDSSGISALLMRFWFGLHGFDREPGRVEHWETPEYLIRRELPAMGKELKGAAKFLPSALGPAPLDICTHWKAFKKNVSVAWVLMFGVSIS